MKTNHLIFYLLTFAVFVISCSSYKKKIEIKNEISKAQIPPNNVRVSAEIIKILPATDQSKKELCSSFSCRAIVQINKVFGYGNSFPTILSSNKQIEVYFKHTLSSTKETKLKLNYSLPGLLNGDRLSANIEAMEKIGKPNVVYTIYYYQKL